MAAPDLIVVSGGVCAFVRRWRRRGSGRRARRAQGAAQFVDGLSQRCGRRAARAPRPRAGLSRMRARHEAERPARGELSDEQDRLVEH
jgi:hypothetical protein